MTSATVDGHHESMDAVEVARSLTAYGEIYLGVDVLLSAIGPGVPDDYERYRAQWSCLIDLLNMAVVHQAAEDAYEVTSFLDRFGITPDDESSFEEGDEEYCHSAVDGMRGDERSYSSESNYTPNQRASSSFTSEAQDCVSLSDSIDFESMLRRPLIPKRQRLQRMKERFKNRISQLLQSASNNTDEPCGDTMTNQDTSPWRKWWQRRRRVAALPNPIESRCEPVADSRLTETRVSNYGRYAPWAVSGCDEPSCSERPTTQASCVIMETSASASRLAPSRGESSMTRVREYAQQVAERSRAATSFVMMETSTSVSRLACLRTESSMSSSRGFAPWAVSDYDQRGRSERSRTATSCAMMETTGSASRLALAQPLSPTRDYSGIVRFFGSLRFRSAG